MTTSKCYWISIGDGDDGWIIGFAWDGGTGKISKVKAKAHDWYSRHGQETEFYDYTQLKARRFKDFDDHHTDCRFIESDLCEGDNDFTDLLIEKRYIVEMSDRDWPEEDSGRFSVTVWTDEEIENYKSFIESANTIDKVSLAREILEQWK